MRFTALAGIEVCALVAGLGAAIVLALQGLSYWALVVQPIVAASFKCAAVWTVSGWKPGVALGGSRTRQMLVYGRQLTAFRFIQYSGRVLDKVLIGYFSGLTQLGFYSNASALVIRPINRFRVPISNVAHAALSRLQGDPARYSALYRAGVLITTAITLPTLGFLLVDGEMVILTLLGPQWRGALPIFRILIVGAFARALGASIPWVYLSLGTTERQLRWGIIEAGTRALSFTIGIFWGATGVAAAYSISTWLLFLPGVLYCFRESPLKPRDLLGGTWRSILACAVAASGLLVSQAYFAIEVPAAVKLAVDLPVFVAIYLLAWLATPNASKMARGALRLAR